MPFPSYAYHPSMKPLSPFFFELTNSFLFVGGSWSVGYPEIMKQWKVSSFLLSPNLLDCVWHYMHACMHACMSVWDREMERERDAYKGTWWRLVSLSLWLLHIEEWKSELCKGGWFALCINQAMCMCWIILSY